MTQRPQQLSGVTNTPFLLLLLLLCSLGMAAAHGQHGHHFRAGDQLRHRGRRPLQSEDVLFGTEAIASLAEFGQLAQVAQAHGMSSEALMHVLETGELCGAWCQSMHAAGRCIELQHGLLAHTV